MAASMLGYYFLSGKMRGNDKFLVPKAPTFHLSSLPPLLNISQVWKATEKMGLGMEKGVCNVTIIYVFILEFLIIPRPTHCHFSIVPESDVPK